MKTYVRRLAVMSLCIVLVACGGQTPGGSSDENPPTSPAPASTDGDAGDVSPEAGEDPAGENPYLESDLCSLIPLDAVAEAAGAAEGIETESSDSPPASCRYTVGLPAGTFPSTASIDIQMLTDFELERLGAGDDAQDVAGIGDEAWEDPHTDTLILFVRRGDLVFWVAAAGGGDWMPMTRNVAELVLATL